MFILPYSMQGSFLFFKKCKHMFWPFSFRIWEKGTPPPPFGKKSQICPIFCCYLSNLLHMQHKLNIFKLHIVIKIIKYDLPIEEFGITKNFGSFSFKFGTPEDPPPPLRDLVPNLSVFFKLWHP